MTRTDTERLHWILDKAQQGWMVTTVVNCSTGFFIQRTRSRGFCDGEERFEDERIAWAPPGTSFAEAIDNAMDGISPDEFLEWYKNTKRKAQRSDLEDTE